MYDLKFWHLLFANFYSLANICVTFPQFFISTEAWLCYVFEPWLLNKSMYLFWINIFFGVFKIEGKSREKSLIFWVFCSKSFYILKVGKVVVKKHC